MRMRKPTWLMVCLLGGCAEVSVAFNERAFELPSMDSAGEGCTRYTFGASSGTSGGTTGSLSSRLTISQHSGDHRVIVDVNDGSRRLVEKVYDQAFLQSERVDEFTVTTAAGESVLLRYWGSPSCAPFDDDGARPSD
jgi:hypothetical protein